MVLWEKARNARGMISPVSNAKVRRKNMNTRETLANQLNSDVHQLDHLAGRLAPHDGLIASAAREKPGHPW